MSSWEGVKRELKGTVEGERGDGEGEWVQFNANQGQEWTSIHTTAQEGDFQVSRREKMACKLEEEGKGGLITKKGSQRGS
jgi:hypothetical protein